MATRGVEELYACGDMRLSPAKHIVSWKCIRSPNEFSRMIHGLRGVLLSKCFPGWGPQTSLLLRAWDSWESKICPLEYQCLSKTILMCENVWKVFIKDIKKLSRPQASFLQQSSFNPSLRLASLSVSCVPKMPTFPYVQQPPDRPWRSEAGQRPWGCSQTRAESLSHRFYGGQLGWANATPNPALPHSRDSSVRAMGTTVLGNHRWTTHPA